MCIFCVYVYMYVYTYLFIYLFIYLCIYLFSTDLVCDSILVKGMNKSAFLIALIFLLK